jgi:4-hydroxy-tetrahydrodipicolinate reductase
MRIGIAGITGRMGKLVSEEVEAAGHEVSGGISRAGSMYELAEQSDVVIDFTNRETIARHAADMMAAGKPWVLGTSGIDSSDTALLVNTSQRVPVVFSSNFSTGMQVVLAFAEKLAELLPAETYDAEILEMHHRQKVDAPSGTAVALGAAVATGRGEMPDDVIKTIDRKGARKTGSIGFASLRGGQVVGEHSVIFAGASEHIELKHRAFDRRSYATGAMQAAQWVVGKAPGLYSMRNVLNI